MATWPSSIPQTPVMGNYDENFSPQTIISQFDVGPIRHRRRSTLKTYPISCTFKMTRTQVNTFLSFYDTGCAKGTSLFTWTHPATGEALQAHFLDPPQVTADMYYYYTVRTNLQIIEG